MSYGAVCCFSVWKRFSDRGYGRTRNGYAQKGAAEVRYGKLELIGYDEQESASEDRVRGEDEQKDES